MLRHELRHRRRQLGLMGAAARCRLLLPLLLLLLVLLASPACFCAFLSLFPIHAAQQDLQPRRHLADALDVLQAGHGRRRPERPDERPAQPGLYRRCVHLHQLQDGPIVGGDRQRLPEAWLARRGRLRCCGRHCAMQAANWGVGGRMSSLNERNACE